MAIRSLSQFPPSKEYKNGSYISNFETFKKMHQESLDDPEKFWSPFVEELYWKKLPNSSQFCNYNFDLRKGPIFVKWFEGAITNICYNALDRNLERGKGDQIAFYWEGNDPADSMTFTYKQLYSRVCQCANVLKKKGVKKGDCVGIYMPMIIEIVISMLACARIGAIHSVVFGGYSAEAVAMRIFDADIKVLITADGVWRGTKLLLLKEIVDKTLELCRERGHHVTTSLVVQHVAGHNSHTNSNHNSNNYFSSEPGKRPITDLKVKWDPEVDCWWHEEMALVEDTCEPEWMDAEDVLFYLYTSGSTGKPKGIVHTIGGFMVFGMVTFRYNFDYKPGDVFFCTADIGWLTGHTYTVYGPLLDGGTCVMYEGVPCHPDPGRYWQIVEKYKAQQFYTAPTAIRTLMRYSDAFVTKYDRSSIKLLGTVGEPLNKEAWHWYYSIVGENRCPIIDTYWQTETGGQVIVPLPGCTLGKPESAGFSVIGVDGALMDESGKEIIGPGSGFLVFKKPWPAILRTILNDHDRLERTYFTKFPGYYNTGDGARRDEDGYYYITGRLDDMLNISGHLLSTIEVENALLEHSHVVEAGVVAYPHPIKGECLYCFVVIKEEYDFDEALARDLSNKVSTKIGRFAAPEYIHPVTALPKSRSGKMMRRLMRCVARGDHDLGDLSTVADASVLDNLYSTKPFQNQNGSQVYRFT